MKIVFFGASHFVLPVVESLNKNFDLSLAITTEKQKIEPIIKYCIENNIPYLCVKNSTDLVNNIQKIEADLGVVADFGVILKTEMLNSFTNGILNIHPSLLPKYRGPTPVQNALLNRDKTTGVTVIKLDEEVDHGPILAQENEDIESNDTTQSLYERLFKKGANLLEKIIPDYVENKVELREQNHENATFTNILKREDGFIDVENLEDDGKLNLMIKAYFPWPGVWTKANVNANTEKIVKFLPSKKVHVEGKKEMSYKDFLNGYPDANSKLRTFLQKYA